MLLSFLVNNCFFFNLSDRLFYYLFQDSACNQQPPSTLLSSWSRYLIAPLNHPPSFGLIFFSFVWFETEETAPKDDEKTHRRMGSSEGVVEVRSTGNSTSD